MRKGDMRKLEFLQTAETLFCRKGYEATGVQEILDTLNASKGSFYHHFQSKESILEQICARRARQIHEGIVADAGSQMTAAGKLNTLLSGMIPLHDGKISFLMMLLPVFQLPEGRMVRECYCEELSECFREDVISCLKDGCEQGELVSSDPDTDADILLTLDNDLWVRLCRMILEAEDKGREPDLSECMRIADRYRSAAERMLSLPFGSLELVDIPMLSTLCEKIHAHWARSSQLS